MFSMFTASGIGPGSNRFIIAETLFNKGDYPESLKVLKEPDPAIIHTICRDASDNLLRARNYLCLNKDAEAWQCIEAIPEKISDYNPLIDAELLTVKGILYRRESHGLFKEGRIEEALEKVNASMTSLNLSEVSARNAGKHGRRLFYNSRLNKLYSRGLKLLITEAPPTEYIPLVVESVICEYYSRKSMPDDDRNYVTGSTIIADLAYGAGVDIEQMRHLTEDPEYKKAYCAIFGNGAQTWPEHLLGICQYTPGQDALQVKNDIIAKALLLGLKMLLAGPVLDSRKLHSYAYELRYCSDMMALNGASLKVRTQISEMFAKLPEDVYKYAKNYRIHR